MTSLDLQINDYLAEISADELKNIMSEEELNDLRSKFNPYGRVIQGSNKVLVFSYTDLQKAYMEKLLTTTMVAYLNRACDEWEVPNGIVVTPVYDYVKNPNCMDLNPDAKYSEDYLEDHKKNIQMMEKRIIVKEFLEHCFQFDPDIHVRSGYKPNPLDPERQTIPKTPAASLAIEHRAQKDLTFRNDMMKYMERIKNNPRISVSETSKKKRKHRRKGKKNKNEVPMLVGIQKDPPIEASKETKNEEPLEEVPKDEIKECVFNIIPPADLFYRLNAFYVANYEALRDATRILYCEKSDFETAVMPYGMFENYEEADNYIEKHRNEVIAPMYKVQSGTWGIIGPFAAIEESVRYYNEKTTILEEIIKQRESDAKIGEEIMKKNIKIGKNANIKKHGEHDPAFTRWRKDNKTLSMMSMTEESDTPENALEVDVFRLSHNKHSGNKEKIYTEAIPPDEK